MTRINSGLLLSALALGTAAIFGSAPAEARPAIVERLAEINARGTEKDRDRLAFNSRIAVNATERPEPVWTASGDGFSVVGDEVGGRPAIVVRLAELNARGTEKDHGGLAFNNRTLR
ncbi:MAG: hypothetical protein AAFY57_10790 [Cyanobacteria bacterium J06642_2]